MDRYDGMGIPRIPGAEESAAWKGIRATDLFRLKSGRGDTGYGMEYIIITAKRAGKQ